MSKLGRRCAREIASAPTTGIGKALLLPLPELSRMAWGNASIYSEAWEVEREGAWPGVGGSNIAGLPGPTVVVGASLFFFGNFLLF